MKFYDASWSDWRKEKDVKLTNIQVTERQTLEYQRTMRKEGYKHRDGSRVNEWETRSITRITWRREDPRASIDSLKRERTRTRIRLQERGARFSSSERKRKRERVAKASSLLPCVQESGRWYRNWRHSQDTWNREEKRIECFKFSAQKVLRDRQTLPSLVSSLLHENEVLFSFSLFFPSLVFHLVLCLFLSTLSFPLSFPRNMQILPHPHTKWYMNTSRDFSLIVFALIQEKYS